MGAGRVAHLENLRDRDVNQGGSVYPPTTYHPPVLGVTYINDLFLLFPENRMAFKCFPPGTVLPQGEVGGKLLSLRFSPRTVEDRIFYAISFGSTVRFFFQLNKYLSGS